MGDQLGAATCVVCGVPVPCDSDRPRRRRMYCGPACKSKAGHRKHLARRSAGRARRAPTPVSDPVGPVPGELGLTGTRGRVETSAIDYTEDEVAFLKAVDRYRREKKRPFPTLSELLAILRALGWRKGDGRDAPAGAGKAT